jgi:hypothetical protein
LSDAVTVALISGGVQVVGLALVGALSYATNRTVDKVAVVSDLTRHIVDGQKTAMELLVTNLKASIVAKDDELTRRQQQLHDAGAVVPRTDIGTEKS